MAKKDPETRQRKKVDKLGKPFRRTGKLLAQLAKNPMVAEAIATGLIAMATAIRDQARRKADPAPPAPASSPAKTPRKRTGDKTTH